MDEKTRFHYEPGLHTVMIEDFKEEPTDDIQGAKEGSHYIACNQAIVDKTGDVKDEPKDEVQEIKQEPAYIVRNMVEENNADDKNNSVHHDSEYVKTEKMELQACLDPHSVQTGTIVQSGSQDFYGESSSNTTYNNVTVPENVKSETENLNMTCSPPDNVGPSLVICRLIPVTNPLPQTVLYSASTSSGKCSEETSMPLHSATSSTNSENNLFKEYSQAVKYVNNSNEIPIEAYDGSARAETLGKQLLYMQNRSGKRGLEKVTVETEKRETVSQDQMTNDQPIPLSEKSFAHIPTSTTGKENVEEINISTGTLKKSKSVVEDTPINNNQETPMCIDVGKPYKCGLCENGFTEVKHLSKHLRQHHPEVLMTALEKPRVKLNVCVVCGYSTFLADKFKEHKMIHTVEIPCESSERDLKDRHIRSPKEHKCNVCLSNFTSIRSLKNHKMSHAGDKEINTQEKIYKCEICPYSGTQKRYLRRHIQNTHTKGKHEKLHTCDVCEYKTRSNSRLKLHMRTHTGEKPYKCDFCEYRCALKSYLKVHIQCKHPGNNLYSCDELQTCDVCEYKTHHKSRLKLHMRTHTGEKPYKCDLCEYRCALKSHLKVHIQCKHSGNKPFLCDECGYRACCSSELQTHKVKHTGVKNYMCDVCGICFGMYSSLKKHQRIHTRNESYKCHECGVSTKRLSDLKRHQRVHTRKKSYKCHGCGFCTTHLSNLKRHQLIHTGIKPHKCHECGYRTVRFSSLKTHQRIHRRNEWFKCHVCRYSSARMSSLKIHMIKHTGEKPYRCDVCGFRTAHNWYLKRHQMKHSLDKP